MNNATRVVFNLFCASLATNHGQTSAAQMFTVAPDKAMKIISAIQEGDAFLKQTSLLPVDNQKGRVISVGAQSSVASRTDTSGGTKRAGKSLSAASERSYDCRQVNFDVAIPYADLDLWAHLPEFHKRAMEAVSRVRSTDLLKIGFYGNSDDAATTNSTTYPLLQDVGKGWLQTLIDEKPANYITEIVEASGKIKIGATGDFKNVDQLIGDMLTQIPVEHRTGNEIVIIGSGLLASRDSALLGAITSPTEDVAGKSSMIAGLKHVTPSFFPDNGLWITDPKNLQIYIQNSSIRRRVTDTPESDCVTDWMSKNIDHNIGNLDAIIAIDAAAVEFV